MLFTFLYVYLLISCIGLRTNLPTSLLNFTRWRVGVCELDRQRVDRNSIISQLELGLPVCRVAGEGIFVFDGRFHSICHVSFKWVVKKEALSPLGPPVRWAVGEGKFAFDGCFHSICHVSFKWGINKEALSPPQATDLRTFTYFVVSKQ